MKHLREGIQSVAFDIRFRIPLWLTGVVVVLAFVFALLVAVAVK